MTNLIRVANHLVGGFNLPIKLGIVGCRRPMMNHEKFHELFDGFIDEMSAVIIDYS